MSFIAVVPPRHASEADAFDRFVTVLWILSDIVFEVFGRFFWTALALLYLKAIG